MLTALAIVVLSTLLATRAPFSFVHPDEQSAAWQAFVAVGQIPPFPEDLRPLERYFRPFNTNIVHGDAPRLQTAFHAVGSIGFAYPIYLAPFVVVSPHAAYVTNAISLALLYLGAVLLLDPRRSGTWLLALPIVAIPPILTHSSILFSNLPGLGFHVLGVGLVAEALRAERPWLVTLGVAAAFLAAAVRRDYMISLAVLLVLLPIATYRGRTWFRLVVRPAAGAIALALAFGALAFFWAHATWGLPYAHEPDSVAGTNFTSLGAVRDHIFREISARQGSGEDAIRASNSERYLFGFLPAVLLLGGLFGARAPSVERAPWLLLPLGLQGLANWLVTSGVAHYGWWCTCLDGSPARYLFPAYAALLLLGMMTVREAAERLPTPAARRAAVAFVALLLTGSGIGHAWAGEQGIEWVHEQRSWHAEHDALAQQLPPNAVVAGDYLSKIVNSRPVLVPAHAGPGLPDLVRALDALGRPVYVHQAWQLKDEAKEPYGPLLLGSGNFFFRTTTAGGFLQVVHTNATVRNIYDFAPGEWLHHEQVPALEPVGTAHFRPTIRPAVSLPIEDWTLANATLYLVYYEEGPGATVTVGYGDAKGAAGNVLAAWNTTGTGEWRTAKIAVPKGLPVRGQFFVEGFALIHTLEWVWKEENGA